MEAVAQVFALMKRIFRFSRFKKRKNCATAGVSKPPEQVAKVKTAEVFFSPVAVRFALMQTAD